MATFASRLAIVVLIAVHLFLLVWAIAGFIELLTGRAVWEGATSPEFPEWMLWAQWPPILLTALAFLVGYAVRWPLMPHAVVAGYVVLGALCAYQTFFLLTHDTRFIAMAVEYAAYIVIGLFLFRSALVNERLGAQTETARTV